MLIVLLIIFYNFNVYKGFKDKRLNDEYSEYRQGIYEATKILKKIDKDEARLLTFDPKLMVWAILNNIKHINVLSGQMVPKKHHMIENDLINNFKFLQLNADSLLNFFENKIYPWRLYNPNTQLFFWGRYSASTLRTYNNSKNFNQNELAAIRKTSPLNVQSIAIPRGEFIRLRDKFINFKSEKIFKVLGISDRDASMASIADHEAAVRWYQDSLVDDSFVDQDKLFCEKLLAHISNED